MSVFNDEKFKELESTCARIILEELMNGSLRSGIRQVILEVLYFSKEQKEQDKG